MGKARFLLWFMFSSPVAVVLRGPGLLPKGNSEAHTKTPALSSWSESCSEPSPAPVECTVSAGQLGGAPLGLGDWTQSARSPSSHPVHSVIHRIDLKAQSAVAAKRLKTGTRWNLLEPKIRISNRKRDLLPRLVFGGVQKETEIYFCTKDWMYFQLFHFLELCVVINGWGVTLRARSSPGAPSSWRGTLFLTVLVSVQSASLWPRPVISKFTGSAWAVLRVELSAPWVVVQFSTAYWFHSFHVTLCRALSYMSHCCVLLSTTRRESKRHYLIIRVSVFEVLEPGSSNYFKVLLSLTFSSRIIAVWVFVSTLSIFARLIYHRRSVSNPYWSHTGVVRYDGSSTLHIHLDKHQ